MAKQSKKTVEQMAAEDAREAIREGATAPWGDGETFDDAGDLARFHGVERFTKEQELEYDRVFRATIAAEAPKAARS